jgi:4-hydroxy-tetrahydrodipicolinate synthase
MDFTKLIGTGVAIVTPFRKDGSIDFKSLTHIIDHVIKGNVEYIVVLGTTGESVTLSQDEKQAVVSHVIDHVNGRIPIVIGCGGNNTQIIVDNIRKMDTEGISAVLSVSPYYNKPSQEGIYRHYKEIASASSLPVIIYNVPGRTGSNISAETTLRLAKLSNIIAIKEASGNLCQVMEIIKNKPADFLVISGDDALSFPIISLGGSGVISVIANAYPSEFSEMVRKLLANKPEEARIHHYHLLDMMTAIFEEGNPVGIKAALKVIGITDDHVRLPLVPATNKLTEKITTITEMIKKNNTVMA